MPASVGGLYLQVKLQTDQAERELKQLAAAYDKAFAGSSKAGAAASAGPAAAVVAQTRAATAATRVMEKQRNAAHAAALKEDAARTLSAQKAAAAQIAAAQRAATASAAAAQRSAGAQTAAQARASKAHMDQLAREIRAQSKAADQAVKDAQRTAAAAQKAAAQQIKAAQKASAAQVAASKKATDAAAKGAQKQTSLMGALGAGSQQLLVGLGAARSGNYFYGLAAGARYAKNLTAALSGSNAALKMMTVGAVAASLAVVAVGAALALTVVKMMQFGLATAASFQTLEIQFTGLLGSAQRAKEEMNFLLTLGQQSIVPTEALMDADRQMLAFGVTTDSVRRGLVQFISDFGTATTASTNQIYFMGLALGQVAAQGKANTVDMKQLANAGVSTQAIYKIIGQQIGVSTAKVREGVGDGIVTADRLFAALTTYGAEFASTAEAARLSTAGLMSNIVDTVTVQFGLAFKGMNAEASSALQGVLAIVQKIDFTRIVTAIQAVGTALSTLWGNSAVQSTAVVDFFNNTLPQAINIAGWAITDFIRIFKIVNDAMLIAWDAVRMAIEGIIWGWAKAGAAAVNVMDYVGVIGDEQGAAARAYFAGLEKSAGDAAANSANAMRGQFAEMKAEWEQPWYKSLVYTITAAGPFQNGLSKAAIEHATPKPPKPEKDTFTPGGSSSGGSAAPDPAIAKAQAWLEKYKKLLAAAEAARKKLVQLTRSLFGEMSDLQKAMRSGSVDTIIGMNQQLREQLFAFYKPLMDAALVGKAAAAKARESRLAALTTLDQDTKKLLDLARRRTQIMEQDIPANEERWAAAQEKFTDSMDKLNTWKSDQETAINTRYDGLLAAANSALDTATGLYDDANSKLQALISERDSFLTSVADSIRSFVDGLTLVETEIAKYTRLDQVGSFIAESQKQTASFKDTLAERLQVLRTWTANIRSLMARGLDSNLIQQFVSAGVEGSGAVVTQLAGADSQTLAEINVIQSALTSEIAAFTTVASAQWFDAGVAQGEAYVAPLRAAMVAAQAEVARLEAARVADLAAMQADFDAKKAIYDSELASAQKQYTDRKTQLDAELKLNADAAQATTDQIQLQFTNLTTGALATGIHIADGLIAGMTSKNDAIVAAAKATARLIKNALNDALGVASPSKVAMYTGEMVGAGLAAGMNASRSKVALASTKLAVMTMPALRSTTMPTSTSFTGLNHGASLGDVTQSSPAFNVRVYVGDRELTDIVDTRIEAADGRSLAYVNSGRRL